MMRLLKWFLLILMLLIAIPAIVAQQCESVLNEALEMSSTDCYTTGRNEVCYGHNAVTAQPNNNVDTFEFDEQGDIVPLQEIATMELSALDETLEAWGIVIIRAQAQLPDTIPGQNVTIVLFGDVTFENEGVDANGVHAFQFATGIAAGRCNEVPLDGVMIQTPEYEETLVFRINGTQVELGSTAFLQTITENGVTFLQISMLDGNGIITAIDETIEIIAEQQTRIVLNSNLSAAEAPTPAESYDTEEVAILYEYVEALEFADCTVSTDTADSAALRLGPGTNRMQRAWLEVNQRVTVTGISDDGEWWQLDKFEAFPSGADSVLELWVSVEEVETNGDCRDIQSASAPPVIPAAQATTENNTPSDNVESSHGQARVRIWADNTVLSANQCTNINWDIEFVHAIYLVHSSLGTIPLTGITNSYWVCPSGTTTYYIRVIYTDNTSEDFPITLTVQ